MKLSQIRPCDNCGRKIAPSFYVARFSIALFNPRATNEVLGMTQYFHGALGLAEIMSPRADVITVAMDEAQGKELMVELFVCAECYLQPLCLAELAEKRIIQQRHGDVDPRLP